MAEKTVREKIEPAMKSLDDRVAMLEENFNMGKEWMESFTRENPIRALCAAFLVGAGLGFILGKAITKDRLID